MGSGWQAGKAGQDGRKYGFNPDYMARIGDVERAAGHRSAADYVPSYGTSKKNEKRERDNLKGCACAVWIIPADPLDGWFWSFETPAARWEGVIMPRRV